MTRVQTGVKNSRRVKKTAGRLVARGVKNASVKNASVKNSSVKNASVKNASVKNASVKNASVKNASVKNASVKNASVKNSGSGQAVVGKKTGDETMRIAKVVKPATRNSAEVTAEATAKTADNEAKNEKQKSTKVAKTAHPHISVRVPQHLLMRIEGEETELVCRLVRSANFDRLKQTANPANCNALWWDLTPLMWAACLGEMRANFCDLLLKLGADPCKRNSLGLTAAHLASEIGNCEFIVLLPDHSIDIPDNIGITPLMIAAFHNQAKTVEILLSKGADVQACDKENNTARVFASSTGKCNVMDRLHVADKAVRKQLDTYVSMFVG